MLGTWEFQILHLKRVLMDEYNRKAKAALS